ncbi:hypothetical protein CPC08DRAFT_783066 [Agrocybe pediades]|nr:hypothetical protein CPC08DRAFT_783066 [Agrocybe pediades]
MSESSPTNTLVTFSSRHTAGISLSLSRYHGQWFITFPRPYGMISPSRISKCLNDPKLAAAAFSNETEEHTWHHKFWLNPTVPSSSPYDPAETDTKLSRAYDGEGKEVECPEVEVLITESGLLRQCYYCLAWEGEGQTECFKSSGDDAFWCSLFKRRHPLFFSANQRGQ